MQFGEASKPEVRTLLSAAGLERMGLSLLKKGWCGRLAQVNTDPFCEDHVAADKSVRTPSEAAASPTSNHTPFPQQRVQPKKHGFL